MSTFAEEVALDLLCGDGIEGIWKLHLAASQAEQIGHREAAERLVEIADAAEELCWRYAIKSEGSWAPSVRGCSA